MQTKINTKDLLKLINPMEEGIFYKGQKIKIDLKEITSYINNPKEKSILENSDDVLIDFYRKVSFHIINANKEPKLISIDLNNENPIVSGLFDYVTSIYRKEPVSYIELDELGDNELLIKKNKLTANPENVLKAQDIQLFTKTFFKETVKIVEEKKIDWDTSDVDLYSNEDFLIEKITEAISSHKDKVKASRNYVGNDDLNLVMEYADKNVLNLESFKIKLLNLNDDYLINLLLDKEYEDIDIKFNESFVQEKLLSDIKAGKFSLLNSLFECKRDRINGLDLSVFINQPETIKYLKDKYFYKSRYSRDNDFSLSEAYSYFYEHNKEDIDIVNKYIEQITIVRDDKSTYINKEDLNLIPMKLFNKEDILLSVLKSINFREFKEELIKQNETNNFLSDKKFILDKCMQLSNESIKDLLKNFVPISEIDKPFILSIIEKRPNFYEKLYNYNNYHYTREIDVKLKRFKNDLDVIMTAYNKGFKARDIPFEAMEQHFLIDSKDESIENFKRDYLIKSGLNNRDAKELYSNKADIDKFNELYNKIEYSFFNDRDSFWYHNDKKHKSLTKIKSKEEILTLLEIIDEIPGNFDAASFYKNLAPTLKKDKDILMNIPNNHKINYENLDDSLKYNIELSLYLIKKDSTILSKVPTEFFNDRNFSLEIAKLMDEGNFEEKNIPLFINKFFINQNIESDYYEYLKKYLLYTDIQDNTGHVEVSKTTKKKI